MAAVATLDDPKETLPTEGVPETTVLIVDDSAAARRFVAHGKTPARFPGAFRLQRS